MGRAGKTLCIGQISCGNTQKTQNVNMQQTKHYFKEHYSVKPFPHILLILGFIRSIARPSRMKVSRVSLQRSSMLNSKCLKNVSKSRFPVIGLYLGLSILRCSAACWPGTAAVRSLINSPKEASCQCELCMADIDCSTRHYVYKAKCTKCGELYVGASRRPIKGRISEHESSFRLNYGRTSLGQHAAEHRRMDNPKYKPITGKRDFETFFKHFEFSIEERCKDTLDTFVREGLAINRIKPKINNMCGNGFTE